MTARKTAAADTADEAQQPGEPVTDTGDSRAQTTLEMIRNSVDVMKSQLRAEYAPELRDLKSAVDNLEALAAQPADDAATKESFAELSDRINDLAATLGKRTDQLEQRLEEAGGVKADAVELAVRPGLGAARKVLEVMRLVDEIGKDRRADLGQGGDYNFRGVDDAMNAVGAAIRKVGLIMSQTVVSSEHSEYFIDKTNRDGQVWGKQQWTTTRVVMRYVFIDPDDGSEHVLEGYGVGKDVGDKDGSKAMAAAMKYALFQGLCIPVKGMNIDPETDHPDSGRDDYAPQESFESAKPARPQTDKTPEQQCADLLKWLKVPGRTKVQLDEQYSAVDGHNLLDLVIPDPQTRTEDTMRNHLNAIRHTLAD